MTRILFQDEAGIEWVMANSQRPARDLVKDINTDKMIFPYARACPPYRQRAVIRGREVVVSAGVPAVALTGRHYDVLFGLVDDLKTEQIARRLGVSRRTVYLYISELKERFAAQSRAQVLLRAVQLGLAAPLPRGD